MKKLLLLAVLMITLISCAHEDTVYDETKTDLNENSQLQRTSDSLQVQTYELTSSIIEDTQDPKDITPPRR